ncbi:hypothetical protein [Paraglaciecola sp. L3A3]|uniref:hypothetical protein n=1 Tax=Paraglaciecola sp. L3A3 TaxID=2686358 RepID=UPI00131B1AD5|nr:hypothetical protein [Paraglaciecola sp. L3A3]
MKRTLSTYSLLFVIIQTLTACTDTTKAPKVAREAKTLSADIIELSAIQDFADLADTATDDYVPSYIDHNTNSRAVDAAIYKDKFSAAHTTFTGAYGIYTATLTALTEIDGESQYSLSVGDKKLSLATNPSNQEDFSETTHIWSNIEIFHGEKITVEFNSVTNGKIPEDEITAYSRGRWTKVEFSCVALCENNAKQSQTAYVEKDGVLVIDLANTSPPKNWQIIEKDSSNEKSYIKWIDNDYYDSPGVGIIPLTIQINNPGRYRFIWSNLITFGEATTDANDSWLKIISPHFFAKNQETNTVVCPKEHNSNNHCKGLEPEGAGNKGWFKIYRFGGPVDSWLWATATNDNDPHSIFADFPQAGTYSLLISGRSKAHAISRLVLFRQDNEKNNVSEALATSFDLASSKKRKLSL